MTEKEDVLNWSSAAATMWVPPPRSRGALLRTVRMILAYVDDREAESIADIESAFLSRIRKARGRNKEMLEEELASALNNWRAYAGATIVLETLLNSENTHV